MIPTSVSERRRVRAGQPRLRAVVSHAHGVCPGNVVAQRTRETAHRHLPARRRRRPERRRPPSARPSTTGRGRASRSRGRAPASNAAIDLDGFFGFNPRLQPLKPFWDRRALAIVHACGSPDGTRSHFDAQDYMETATPGVKSTPDGWLNRYLQAPPAGRAGRRGVPRRRADAAAAAHAAGPGAGAGGEPDRPVRHPRRSGQRHGRRVVRGALRRGRRSRAERHRPRGVRRDQDAEGRGPVETISRKTAPITRAARSARRSSRSRSSPRRTSDSRSRSRTSAAGTRTSTRARRRVSSPGGSTISRAASRRSSPTSAIAWRTPSS